MQIDNRHPCLSVSPGFSPELCLRRSSLVVAAVAVSLAEKSNLNPKTKKWSTGTLACLLPQIILQISAILAASIGAVAGDTTGAMQGAIGLKVVALILYVLAIIFAGIFCSGSRK